MSTQWERIGEACWAASTFSSAPCTAVVSALVMCLAAGDLTIRGVTRTVELAIEFGGGVRDPWGNEKIGFFVQSRGAPEG